MEIRFGKDLHNRPRHPLSRYRGEYKISFLAVLLVVTCASWELQRVKCNYSGTDIEIIWSSME